MKTNSIYIYAALLALTISACKVGKNYQRPAVDLPQQFNAVATADTSSIATLEYKQFFADTTLQNLIDRGIKYNYDLQIALKRIDIAGEQVKQAKLLLLPNLNLQVSGQYNRPSDNSLNGKSASGFLGSNHIEDYNANLALTWELDTWGKIRRQKEAVLAQYLQTYEATKAVQTRLVSDIAQGYYNLLMLDKQLNIAKQNLRLSDTTLQLTQLLKNAGEVNLLAVQQADAQRHTTALLIPQLEQSITIQENALQILTGQLPASVTRHTGIDNSQLPTALPTGVPAGLLSRRPDVRSQEMALKAANAQVGAAQGQMYPSLSITAQGGLESLKSSTWFNIPASLFGIATGSILQPLLNHRSLKTQFETAKLQRDQAGLQFRQSVLNAVGEVSNALVQNEKLQQQRVIASAQVDTLHKAVKNAQLLFKSDMANYLEVITAQTNALQAELNLASIQRQQAGAVVELYRSLGGGWR
ncbi:NodT family efflux transporter outer membrane factor (OMF) lipoprotein [Mucilaginibacter yixingensis]|uniref:NodT family efflux transporter outer membrane factor (OMF) lipoprotein n=1 Tax=Mucilaginibacter yixingensis TaxID=1295612 RepID=A0A2T5JGQ9_9SPHI|nr:efflux transporter outer membrane subunit [Mucilaginibacter yixingensis]PTR01632.1 NodT family efflux transporter outer membrane factor (OMF) lipoprotein [Mucilaginibacter yixingensis]